MSLLEPSRLETSIAGVLLKNPVMPASGTFNRNLADSFDLSCMGAYVAKGITTNSRAGNKSPRVVEAASGMINAIGLEGTGVDYFLEYELPKLRKLNIPIIVNFFGKSSKEYSNVAAQLDVPGVDMIEANVSCPNVANEGMAFGTDPYVLERVIYDIKSASQKPLIAKLTPNVTNISAIAKAVRAAKADAISLINTFRAMKINIKTGHPVLANKTGGLSGPAIHPIAISMVYEVYEAVYPLSIIGMGGITNGDDAIEMMMAGASAVAVGMHNFIDPLAIPKTIAGIKEYLMTNKLGIKTICDLIGFAHKER